ncbi:MAG: alpha/beta fold hydrolase [Myxococcales bacterium]
MAGSRTVREYGAQGPLVLVLHGGPGAPGGVAALCERLSDSFHVLEPFQRGSGEVPLTVERHVEDLHALVLSCPQPRPAIVGHSWGAMLALAYAAAHPDSAGPLALIGCGTFDPESRARLHARCEGRIDEALRSRLEQLEREIADPDERLARFGELLLPVYSHDLVATPPCERPDVRAHSETWDDMLRQQQAGLYPAAFAAFHGPVLMLHGADDPHPGPMIRDSLTPFLPQLEYREWPACGHYPWLERACGDEVVASLRAWLLEHCPS